MMSNEDIARDIVLSFLEDMRTDAFREEMEHPELDSNDDDAKQHVFLLVMDWFERLRLLLRDE